MAPKSGRLSIKLHRATSLEVSTSHEQQVCTVVEVPDYGRMATTLSTEPQWDQELTMEIGPHASNLKVCLYQESAQRQEQRLVGQGCYSLEQLFSEDTPDKLEGVSIPLVNEVGKNSGHLLCSLRFFHARTPGKFRDPLGKEYIDEDVLSSGPREAPKKVNQLSPVASPRARSRLDISQPGSPTAPAVATPTAAMAPAPVGARS